MEYARYERLLLVSKPFYLFSLFLFVIHLKIALDSEQPMLE